MRGFFSRADGARTRSRASLAVVVLVGLATVAMSLAGALEDSDGDSGSVSEPVTSPAAEPPPVRMPEPANGDRALELLGDDLPKAALLNDMPPERLRELLREDPTVWLDRTGRIYYVDVAPSDIDSSPVAASPLADSPDAEPAPTEDPTHSPDPTDYDEVAPEDSVHEVPQLASDSADAFDLHSVPGSRRTIFLDFDGADITGTQWNTELGVPPGFHLGWDPAGDGPDFSSTELSRIRSVWARVSEDYAPFDVNVTTRDPGPAAIERTGSADDVYGTRVLITSGTAASDAICASQCGGVAYLRAFANSSRHSLLQPAWVFPDALGNDSKSVAEAASHEAGHNLGLSHDGGPTGAYYSGHSMWAPIMGSGYRRPLTQWSRGSYPGATNPENDLTVLTAGGVPLRVDEAGDSLETAAPAPPPTLAYISTPDDRDVYALGTCSGSVVAAATPSVVSPNLDLSVTLMDASGDAVLSSDPASGLVNRDATSGLGATLVATFDSRPLFLSIDGVGAHGLTAGYDDYGSLGAYTVQVGGCAASPTEPSLTASPTASPSSSSTSPSGSSSPSAAPSPTPGPSPTASPTATTSAPDASQSPSASPTSQPSSTPQRPAAPTMRRAVSGRKGSPVTVRVLWAAPDSADPPVTSYRLRGERIGPTGAVVTRRSWTLPVPESRTTATIRFSSRGQWRFAVRAGNDVGYGPWSETSAVVAAR